MHILFLSYDSQWKANAQADQRQYELVSSVVWGRLWIKCTCVVYSCENWEAFHYYGQVPLQYWYRYLPIKYIHIEDSIIYLSAALTVWGSYVRTSWLTTAT